MQKKIVVYWIAHYCEVKNKKISKKKNIKNFVKIGVCGRGGEQCMMFVFGIGGEDDFCVWGEEWV